MDSRDRLPNRIGSKSPSGGSDALHLVPRSVAHCDIGARRTTTGRERAIQRLVQKPDGAWYSRRPCCTMADCRMVEARWNDRTQHYEAQVTRERFSTTTWKRMLSEESREAYQAARSAWMRQWLSRYGPLQMYGLKFLKPRSVPFRTRPDTRSFAGQSSTPNPTAYSASSHIRGSDRLPASGERHARSCDGFEPVGVRRRIGRHHQGYRELRLCAAQVFDCCDQH